MECKACGLTHQSWVRCEVARRLQELEGKSDGRTEKGQIQKSVAGETDTAWGKDGARGSEKDMGMFRPKFDKKAYQREYMRKRREKARKTQEVRNT